MKNYRRLLDMSYQRAISPDFELFFKRFYDNLINTDPQIAALFSNTDMDRQVKMLMQSMTLIISFAATMEADGEIYQLAIMHGKDKLNVPAEMYDIWLECLVDTVKECDPEFNSQVETAWRVVMSPGLEYMKSYCSK
jgi:hemoglobin-like flavoprotein